MITIDRTRRPGPHIIARRSHTAAALGLAAALVKIAKVLENRRTYLEATVRPVRLAQPHCSGTCCTEQGTDEPFAITDPQNPQWLRLLLTSSS